jgi:hypothetical protein
MLWGQLRVRRPETCIREDEMSKTRKPATRAQIEAHLKAFDDWSATDTMVNDYIRALWAREKLLEAVVKEARRTRGVWQDGLDRALDALDAHDKENPR